MLCMQDYGVNLICVEDGIDSSKEAGKLLISAVFHLMVLSHMKEDVLEFHTVMFNIPAVFKEKILHCISMTWS